MTDTRIPSTHLRPAQFYASSRPRSGGWSRGSSSSWRSSTSWIAIAPFFGTVNIRPLLHRVALFGVLAVGAAVVIIAGGIDLSTGAVVALSSVVSAKLLTEWLRTGGTNAPPPSVPIVALAIGLTLLMGLTIGLVARSHDQRAAASSVHRDAGDDGRAAQPCHHSLPEQNDQRLVRRLSGAGKRSLGRRLSIFACVAVFMSILMGWTVLGRHLFALGGNETAARLSGLRTNRLKAVAYGLAGTLSALGGILFTGYSGQADSRLGTTYELTAITAAVVGGCSLSGGLGSIRGTVLGLLLTQIVLKGTGILVKGIDSTQIEGLVLGTVVLLAVAFNQRFRGGSRLRCGRPLMTFSSRIRVGPVYRALNRTQRFENWKLLRAFLWPYFLRSTMRASRVSKPCSRSFASRSGRNSLRARASPSMTAPDWLSLPLPRTLTKTSMRPPISVTWQRFADVFLLDDQGEVLLGIQIVDDELAGPLADPDPRDRGLPPAGSPGVSLVRRRRHV